MSPAEFEVAVAYGQGDDVLTRNTVLTLAVTLMLGPRSHDLLLNTLYIMHYAIVKLEIVMSNCF